MSHCKTNGTAPSKDPFGFLFARFLSGLFADETVSLSVATLQNNLKFCFCFFNFPAKSATGDASCTLRENVFHILDAGSTHKAAPLCCWPLSCTTRAGGCLASLLDGFCAVILESIGFIFCIFPRLRMEINDWQLHQKHCPHGGPLHI